MKIYYLSLNPKIEIEVRKKLERLGDFIYLSTKDISEREILDQIKEVEILLVSPSVGKITDVFFESLHRLKHLALLSSGFDWVDVSSAAKHMVSVSYCKGANAESVAEYTWGILLSLVRNLNQFRTGSEGDELFGKTIGILGTGNIGVRVARIAKAFNMTILGFNKSHRCPRYFDEIVDLETLLVRSNFISINLPLIKETKGLIGEYEVSIMRQGVYVVNTAREEIVDYAAILNGVETAKIRGYGVDLNITNRLSVGDGPYYKHKNILDTPHMGYNTKEAKKRMMEMAIRNIGSFIEGKPVNLVAL